MNHGWDNQEFSLMIKGLSLPTIPFHATQTKKSSLFSIFNVNSQKQAYCLIMISVIP